MAIDLFNEFATNAEAEEHGVWQDFAPGVKFLIARTTNKHYSRALTKAFEKNRTVLSRTTDAAEAMSEDIMIGVIARTILLDWQGVVYKGKPFEYSLENARELSQASGAGSGQIQDLDNKEGVARPKTRKVRALLQWNLRWGSEIQTLLGIRDSTGLVPSPQEVRSSMTGFLFYRVFSNCTRSAGTVHQGFRPESLTGLSHTATSRCRIRPGMDVDSCASLTGTGLVKPSKS